MIRAIGPYPPVEAERHNAVYAEMMLGNIGGKNSELSTVAHYRYNRLMTAEEHGELSELMHKISVVEMQHFDLFGRLAKLLGADPRMWQSVGCKKKYWTPGYVDYEYESLRDMLQKLLDEERGAIKKYTAQLGCIQDAKVAAVLKRVIEDEREHVKTWEEEIAKLG